MQNDLPGGGRRLVMPAEGIEYTVVNGPWSMSTAAQRRDAGAGDALGTMLSDRG